MGGTIDAEHAAAPTAGAGLSLIFAKGQRPDSAAVSALAAGSGAPGRAQGKAPGEYARFAVSHAPGAEVGWLELLVSGMAIDCHGLSPAMPAPAPPHGGLLGLGEAPVGEAVLLQPGPHLADAAALLPVVRATVALGLGLTALPGLLAVCWNPAASWMAPAHFRKVAASWLEGGPFPALGLTSLHRDAKGAMESHGLAFFTGQELLFPPTRGFAAADQARIAVRLINDLVARDSLTKPIELTGPGGEAVVIAPILSEGRLRIIIRRDPML